MNKKIFFWIALIFFNFFVSEKIKAIGCFGDCFENNPGTGYQHQETGDTWCKEQNNNKPLCYVGCEKAGFECASNCYDSKLNMSGYDGSCNEQKCCDFSQIITCEGKCSTKALPGYSHNSDGDVYCQKTNNNANSLCYIDNGGGEGEGEGKSSLEEGTGGGFLMFHGSIVPCGRNCDDSNTAWDESKSCTLCHFFIMFKQVYDLFFSLLIIVALTLLTIGGVVYIVSGGNTNAKTIAKNIISKALLGFALFLTSWLLVFTILKFISANTEMLGNGEKWYEFDCDTKSVFDEKEEKSSKQDPKPPEENKKLTTNPEDITFIRSSNAQDKEKEIKVYYSDESEVSLIDEKTKILGAEKKDVTMEAEYSSTDENIASINKDTTDNTVTIYSIADPTDGTAPDLQEATIIIKYKEYTTTVDVSLFKTSCTKSE